MVLMENVERRERKVWTDSLDQPAHNEERRETGVTMVHPVKMVHQEVPRPKVTVVQMDWMDPLVKRERRERGDEMEVQDRLDHPELTELVERREIWERVQSVPKVAKVFEEPREKRGSLVGTGDQVTPFQDERETKELKERDDQEMWDPKENVEVPVSEDQKDHLALKETQVPKETPEHPEHPDEMESLENQEYQELRENQVSWVDVDQWEKKVTEDLLERKERKVFPDLVDLQEQRSIKPDPKVSEDDQEQKENPDEPEIKDYRVIKDKRESQELVRSRDKREFLDRLVQWVCKVEKVNVDPPGAPVLQDQMVHEVSKVLKVPRVPWVSL